MSFAVYTIVFYSVEYDEIDFYEANNYKETNEFVKNITSRGDRVIKIYDKNTPISHYDFEKVPEDTPGIWFVSQLIIDEEGVTRGYYFDSVSQLKMYLPKLVKESGGADWISNGEDFVTIFPPDAKGWDLDTFEIIMMFTPNLNNEY